METIWPQFGYHISNKEECKYHMMAALIHKQPPIKVTPVLIPTHALYNMAAPKPTHASCKMMAAASIPTLASCKVMAAAPIPTHASCKVKAVLISPQAPHGCINSLILAEPETTHRFVSSSL